MSRKCRHQLNSISSTLRVFQSETIFPLYMIGCTKCDAHTPWALSIAKANQYAMNGYLYGGDAK